MKKKLAITLFFILSIIVHHLLFDYLYRTSKVASVGQNEKIEVARLLEVEKPKPEKKKTQKVQKKKQKPKKKVVSKQISKPPVTKSKKNKPNDYDIIASGKKILNSSLKGSFPPLSLNYDDPKAFFKGIYAIGGKTYLFDEVLGKLIGEIDLITFTSNTAGVLPQHFSPFKRVVEDQWVEMVKKKLVNDYGGWSDDYQVLLLIPENLEARWIGHQLNLFLNHQLAKEEIAKVEANFKNKKLMVQQIVLKDGRIIGIQDKGV